MKKIFFLLVAFAVFSLSVIAQETTQNRNVSFYLDAVSGQLAPGYWVGKEAYKSTHRSLFTGIEHSFGIRYSQNFKNVPWLSVGGTFDTTWNYNPLYDNDGKTFIGLQPGKQPVGIKANAWVAVPYFMLLLDTRGLMGGYVNWSKSLGKAGSLGLGAEIEYFFMSSSYWASHDNGPYLGETTPDKDTGETDSIYGAKPNYVIDYVGLVISYSIGLPKGFAFSSTLNPRMDANPANGWAGVEKDAKAALHLRWNNTLSLSVDSWSGYVQVRYDAYDLAQVNYKSAHQFQLLAGMSYGIDVAK